MIIKFIDQYLCIGWKNGRRMDYVQYCCWSSGPLTSRRWLEACSHGLSDASTSPTCKCQHLLSAIHGEERKTGWRERGRVNERRDSI